MLAPDIGFLGLGWRGLWWVAESGSFYGPVTLNADDYPRFTQAACRYGLPLCFTSWNEYMETLQTCHSTQERNQRSLRVAGGVNKGLGRSQRCSSNNGKTSHNDRGVMPR